LWSARFRHSHSTCKSWPWNILSSGWGRCVDVADDNPPTNIPQICSVTWRHT
jgi:hypothetical protein